MFPYFRLIIAALLLVQGLTGSIQSAARSSLSEPRLLVDDTLDVPDVLPGDGICATAKNTCTLRAAIQESNRLPERQVIVVPPGLYRLTRSGPVEEAAMTGDLDVIDDTTLLGAGSAQTFVDGRGIDRIFDIAPGNQAISVTLSALTIRGGVAQPDEGSEGLFRGGGGVRAGTHSTIVVESSIVTENSAPNGGGIFNRGNMRLVHTSVLHNKADADFGVGGGLATIEEGILTLEHSLVDGNTARQAGGIFKSTTAEGTLMLRRSVVSRNSCTLGGGGIYNTTGGDVNIENSTISGNTCGMGGGLFNDGGTTITLRFSTITDNEGDLGGGIVDVHGGGARLTRLDGSIVAGNRGPFLGPDCSGPIASLGRSILGNDSGCITHFQPDDLVNVDARLSPLERYNPLSFGHRPLNGSPALDSAKARCPAVDQRGLPRPLDGDGDGVARCDIGAVEADRTTTATFLPLVAR